MRQVGSLNSQADATRFAAYLTTEGVAAHAEEDGPEWIVWVHDENQVTEAKQAYSDYKLDPNAEAYQGVEQKAEQLQIEESKQHEAKGKNVIEMRGRWKRGASRRQPLITTLIVISVIATLSSNFGADRSSIVYRNLMFFDQAHYSQIEDNRLVDVGNGQFWRIITPIFLHGSWMHIIFNMMMLYQLGNSVEQRRGTWNFGWIVLAIAACSNLAQALIPFGLGGSPFFLGISGVVFGILGYSWMKTRFQPEMGIFVPQNTVIFMLGFMFLMMTPIAGSFGLSVANWAHGIGLVTGMAIGIVPVLVKSISGD